MCQDINFTVSYLASFTDNQNKRAFLALEHLMQYLPSHLLEPIFYPNKERDLPQRITQKNSPTQSKACNTPSYLVYFSDSSIGNILPNRQTMLSYCGFSNGVFTLWSTNIQTLIVADSTDTQLKSLYCTIKKIELNAANISTKASSGPPHTRYWNFLRGLQFHPSKINYSSWPIPLHL